MHLSGSVDYFRPFEVAGWAADRDAPTQPVAVDVLLDGTPIARIPAGGFREDLRAAGWGDGRKAFWFNPMDFLARGENRFEVRHAGTQALLHNGAITLVDDPQAPGRGVAVDPMTHSKLRWSGSEPDASLTWGRSMTGDTFFDAVERHAGKARIAGRNVLEVGPGYGRLLRTLRQRGYGHASYAGLEMSAARVQRLTRELGDARTRFVCGDAMKDTAGSGFDLLICSSTFEHLYPDFVQAIANLRRQMSPDGVLCIDFKQCEPEMLYSCASFEREGGAFVRIYSRPELERLFGRCGLAIEGLSSIALGTGEGDTVVQRIFVCARATGLAGGR